VNGVLLAESAILLHFETVRVILLVFHGIVVSLLALRASQSDFNAHDGTSLKFASLYRPGYDRFSKRLTTFTAPGLKNGRTNTDPFFTGRDILSQDEPIVNNFFAQYLVFLQKNMVDDSAIGQHRL
jgi:hypothetical protein